MASFNLDLAITKLASAVNLLQLLRYFNVGRLDRDQVADYAARKGLPLETVERWLSPNLG